MDVTVCVGVQAACVFAMAVWMACGDGEQAASKIIAKHMFMVKHFLFTLFPFSECVFPTDYYRAIFHNMLMLLDGWREYQSNNTPTG